MPDVLKEIQECKEGDKILILAVFKSHANRDTKEELNILLQKGFSRLYENGEIKRIEEILESAPSVTGKQETYILIDRLVKKEFDEDDLHRIADSVGIAFYEGEGVMHLEINSKKSSTTAINLNWMELFLKSPFPIYFHSTIHLAPVLPAKDFRRYLDWILT